jgi:tight adherence protein B
MQVIILLMFLFTSFLLFMGMFKRIFMSDKKIEERVNRYLHQTNQEIMEPQKFKLALNHMLKQQKISKKLLSKEKHTRLETLLNQAGIPLKSEEYVMFVVISTTLAMGIFYLVFESILTLPIGGMLGYMIPGMMVRRKLKKRKQKFEDHLPEMISTIVGALRAGFSLPQALHSVMEEADSPVKEEIEIVLKEMQYGTTLEDSLNHLKERMPSPDLDLMIQAIIIQRQVGGNLATVLETIVTTIRERILIQGQISTLTAQGRMSGWVLGLLPVFIGFFIYLIEPDYMSVLFQNPIGIILSIFACISCFVGFMLIRKITSIEV